MYVRERGQSMGRHDKKASKTNCNYRALESVDENPTAIAELRREIMRDKWSNSSLRDAIDHLEDVTCNWANETDSIRTRSAKWKQ